MDDTRHFLKDAPIPMALVATGEHRIHTANQAFAAALGADLDELLDSDVAAFFADPARVRERLEAVRSGAEAVHARPVNNTRGDSVLLTVWRIEDGEADLGLLAAAGTTPGDALPHSMSETLREVNEALIMSALREQALADEARAESEAKSVFLASVSHELRTPLNSVLGYADLLAAGVPEALPEPLVKYVDRIRAAAGHLLSLIEQIIEASRAEFEQHMRTEEFDAAALMREVAGMVRPRAAEKQLDLRLEGVDDALRIVADRKKLRQVVLNLLVNAIKFTDEGGVTVTVKRDAPDVVITVADTGIGIEEELHDQIFRRFWQVDGSATRSEGGMGIGLWVVRTLVEVMDGHIELRSAPGEGSEFRVTLPADRHDGP
jgi:signal transduction histidine kinase